MSRSSRISESDDRPGSRSRERTETRLETPNTAIFTKVVYLFRISPYKLVDLCKWSAFVNNRTMRDNCSAAPRLQHCVEITSVSFTVSAVLSRSRLGLEGNCLGLVLVSADSENKCLCLVSVSNTNCLVSVSSRLKLSRTQHCYIVRSLYKKTKWDPGESGATKDPGASGLSEILVQEHQMGS